MIWGARALVPAVAALAALGALAGGAALVMDASMAAGPAARAIPAAAVTTALPAEVGTVAAVAPAQDGDGPAYDGRFTFVRIRFEDPRGNLGSGFFGRSREPFWAHDMPRAERNFSRILAETTTMAPHIGGKVLSFDDPELFRYPVAYIVEVGFWRPSEAEIEALREYLLKGGFLIVDDFRGRRELQRFAGIMRAALPELELVELEPDHEVFDSFFRIEDPSALAPPTFEQYVPFYLGLFEDNDPSKRLMVVANYNNDIAEYWEFSERGYYPIQLSNEAYKFGVNYVVYAMTH